MRERSEQLSYKHNFRIYHLTDAQVQKFLEDKNFLKCGIVQLTICKIRK